MAKTECLMLGVGSAAPRRRLKAANAAPDAEINWTTLDMDRSKKPHILLDLEDIDTGEGRIKRDNETFDEIHAYEVLEHFGHQGDFRGFFRMFRELWRLLKPKGLLIGTSPASTSPWAWGDPGHTRVISPEALSFLRYEHYAQLGTTPSSDYREYVSPCWWKFVHNEIKGHTFTFALEKVVR